MIHDENEKKRAKKQIKGKKNQTLETEKEIQKKVMADKKEGKKQQK